MSQAVPHFSLDWLENYRRKLKRTPAPPTGEGRDNPRRTPAHARATPERPLVPYSTSESVEVPLRAATGKQTDTEKRYNRDVLHGAGRFEAVTLRLDHVLHGRTAVSHELAGTQRTVRQAQGYGRKAAERMPRTKETGRIARQVNAADPSKKIRCVTHPVTLPP